jgi:VWFA-related protein
MRIVSTLAMLVAWTVLPFAQNLPEAVIRTTTSLVEVRVMAEDAGGNPVTDLRREEFHLQDNRKPQPITAFSFENGGGAAGARQDGSGGQASAMARDSYAIILLDWLNPRYADRIAVRQAINQLLKNFQPRQRVALYLLGSNSRLLYDFTSDPGDLLGRLAEVEDEPEDSFDPAKPAWLDARMKTWMRLTVEDRLLSFNAKILTTIGTLQKLAMKLERLPGRKSIVWATNGFPIVLDDHAVPGLRLGAISYLDRVEPLIAHLNRANIALYTLDARGLRTEPPAEQPYADVGTLQELSSRTGGTVVLDRNDLAEGMRRALEDGKTSYTLGFSVPANARPGLHTISLQTTRRGVKLRYRESYYWDEVSGRGR